MKSNGKHHFTILFDIKDFELNCSNKQIDRDEDQIMAPDREATGRARPAKTFRTVEVDLPNLKEGQILIKLTLLTSDTAQRG